MLLNELFDIAPHDVEAKMKSSGNREWLTELEFYSIECDSDTCDSDFDLYETGITMPKIPKGQQPKPAKMTVEMNLKKIFENTTEAAMRVKLSSAAHL